MNTIQKTQNEKLEELKELFKTGEKLTLVEISSSMAMSYRSEIVVIGQKDDNTIIFKYKGKRKQFLFSFERKSYTSAPIKIYEGGVFKGHDVKFYLDTDDNAPRKENNGFLCRSMRGNACYNFLGSKEEIKQLIETSQLNPFFDKTKVLAIDEEGKESLVHPQLYTGGHAVIDQILANG